MPITSHCLTKWSVWQGVSIDTLLDGIETAAREERDRPGNIASLDATGSRYGTRWHAR